MTGYGGFTATARPEPSIPKLNPIRALTDGVSAPREDGRDEAGRDRDGSGEDGVGGDPAGRDLRLVTGAFAALVLLSSVVPVPGSAPANGGGAGVLPLDIGLTDPFHLVGYAVLTVLAGRAIGRGRRGLLLAAGAAVAFGVGVELVQAPIPWRSFAWRDAAVNAVGAGIGLAVLAAGAALGGAETTDPAAP